MTTTKKEQFETELKELTDSIKDKARAQFAYNEMTNIPAKIILPAESITHAINHGIVSAISARNHWGIEPTIELAGDMLEDVNAHGEAAQVRAMLETAAA